MADRYTTVADAAEIAHDQFFVALAERFPEITTGDLPPDADARFRAACETVAHVWVEANRPRALSHDQLQGLGRLADDLSKGSHGAPVVGVALHLRPDGLADVVVNGERQTFAMDEYGHPVDAA